MGDSPLFTVLMPTHNRADVIGYAIRSVLAQTQPDFELLIVGDGCTDGTADVVRAFEDSRIRWFDLPKTPNFGYANRNVALREARGSLVAFAAHDDLLLPDHLERMAVPFEDGTIDWAYSRPVWVSDDGLVIPFAIDLRKPDELRRFLTTANTIPASCVVYRRTCIDRFGFWPEDVPRGGDWAYWKSIVGPSNGANLAYVPDATCLHFRANWHTGAIWGPPPLDAWLLIAAGSSWWPAGLRMVVPHDAAPQATVWHAMALDPPAWSKAMRLAITEAIDGLAWTAAVPIQRIVAELPAMVEALTRATSIEPAITLADWSVTVVPSSARLQATRGAALMAAARLDEAELAFRRAIELDSSVALYHGQLARVLHRQGRDETALTAVDVAIGINPDGAQLRTLRGQVLASLGRNQPPAIPRRTRSPLAPVERWVDRRRHPERRSS